jgi:O-antigen/teichoic acid export membrane protein
MTLQAERVAAGTPPVSHGVPETSSGRASQRHLRGSSLLLVGRLISVVLNFAVQILIVRYLSKSDYGAFAYALGVASIASSAILLGLGKALPRLVPIHRERQDYARAFGCIVLAVGTVLGLGVSLVLLVHGFQSVLGGRIVSDQLSMSLLLILICMAPLDAVDELLQQVVAVFASPRAIFVRRQVMGPGFKLAAVLTVIATGRDAHLLAYGYVLGGAVGVSLYVVVLAREWSRSALLQHLNPATLVLPVRTLFGFSLPLLSSELSILWRGSLAVLMLEYFHSTGAVAEYRAVLPVAGLNMVVFEACAFLFVPHAAQLFARDDAQGISDLYWRTALWITLLTFPILAVTCVFAEPLTVVLFGQEYASAGTLLAILAVGHYVNAALGFNSAALRVHGRLRITATADIVAALVAIGANVLLIPPYGATGAAVSTTGALVLHNALNHLGLGAGSTGVQLVHRAFLKVSAVIAVAMGVLLLLQVSMHPALPIAVAFVGLTTLVVVRVTRREVAVASTFPELLRVPGLRQLLT